MSLEKKITARPKTLYNTNNNYSGQLKTSDLSCCLFSLFLSHANTLNNINRPFLDSDRKTVHKILTTNDLSMRFAKRGV